MPGYLEGYGAGEEQRIKLVKNIVVSTVVIAIVATALYFTFRNFREERIGKDFLALLAKQDYQGAYRMWGCTQETPCKYYPPDSFTKDWGPSSPHSAASQAKVTNDERCGEGVILTVSFPGTDSVPLWVDRTTSVVSFAPWPECPGRRWHFKEFWRSLFS